MVHRFIKYKKKLAKYLLGLGTSLAEGVRSDSAVRFASHSQQLRLTMKITVKRWHAIAQWQWDTGKTDDNGDAEEDVCGICRIPFEGCCPTCKVPGDDCPLSKSPRARAICQPRDDY